MSKCSENISWRDSVWIRLLRYANLRGITQQPMPQSWLTLMMTSATKSSNYAFFTRGKPFSQMSCWANCWITSRAPLQTGKQLFIIKRFLPNFLMCSWTTIFTMPICWKRTWPLSETEDFSSTEVLYRKRPMSAWTRYRKFALACKTLEDRRLMMSFLLHCRIFHRVK